jgi:hypothetical protein
VTPIRELIKKIKNEPLQDTLLSRLEEALEESYDDGYDDGYDDKCRESDDMLDKFDKLEGELADELQARYEYLKHGGEWQRINITHYVGSPPSPSEVAYLCGFLDAMETIGVKP